MTQHDEEHRHRPQAVPTAEAEGAANQLGQDDADQAKRPDAKPKAAPGSGGLGNKLQPGGTVPGGGPGASVGSIGTGGGSTGGAPSGGLKRGGA